MGEADEQREQVPATPPRGRRSATASSEGSHQQREADVPEVVTDVLVPQVRRLGAAGDRVVDAVRREVDALALGVEDAGEPEQRPGRRGSPLLPASAPAAVPVTTYGVSRSIQSAQRVRVSPTSPRSANTVPAWWQDVAEGEQDQPAAERPAVVLGVRAAHPAHGRAAPNRLLRQMLEMRTFSPVYGASIIRPSPM